MDKKTLERYESHADHYIDRYSACKPGRIYEIMAVFFKRKGLTLDIGCASGRDLAYMSGAGYIVEGLDAVQAFVDHCKSTLPSIPVSLDSLPLLSTISDEGGRYDNVLMSAVLMHIPDQEIPEAVNNLLRITKIDGKIIMSIRGKREKLSDGADRENDGRLFTNIGITKLIDLFNEAGGKIIFEEQQVDEEREDVVWYNLVVQKTK